MKCGSATTFAKLSKLYQKRGSILIDVALQPYSVFYGRSEIAIKLAEVEEDLAPSFHLNLRRSSLPVSMAKMIYHMVLKRPRTIAGYMPIFYRQCTVPRAVQMLIKTARIDYLYVNHYFTLPLAKSIKPDVPVFLDTHDIQSLNYISHDYHQLISRRAAPFTECLKEELNIVDVADRVTMVSREEIELFHQYRPNNEYFYYIPIPEAFSRSPRARDPRPSQSPLQALIVASRNPANERSLAWFLTAVWPKVAELPYQLTIVGSINRSFETYSHPKVTFAGLVEDLEAAYNQADLIILPITNGGGIAIKTLEAIQAELPIVCTRHAMRGLPVQVQSLLPGTLTSSELVDDLTRLISSSEALTSRRQQVRMAHQALVSVNFDEQMNHELDLIWARSRS
jgi:glycosyltransferase involved in cell wall biosynthesis